MGNWRSFWVVWGFLMIAAMVFGQQPAKPSPKAPAIPDSLLVRFWKAQTQSQQAQAASAQAQAQMAGVVKEMDAACGPDHQPQMNQTGDPVCAPKPAPAKK